MEQKKHAPGAQGKHAGAKYEVFNDKGNKIRLNPSQWRLYNLLQSGGMYSTADLSQALRSCDPRSRIRDIRKLGITISDIWTKKELGYRHKLYFVKQSGITGHTGVADGKANAGRPGKEAAQ